MLTLVLGMKIVRIFGNLDRTYQGIARQEVTTSDLLRVAPTTMASIVSWAHAIPLGAECIATARTRTTRA